MKHMTWDEATASNPIPQLRILREIRNERQRQDSKWGPVKNHPDGTGEMALNLVGNFPVSEYKLLLDTARTQNDSGDTTYESILREEYCEAMLEADPVKLRAELVQVAAVAVKWIEAIDRRSGL